MKCIHPSAGAIATCCIVWLLVLATFILVTLSTGHKSQPTRSVSHTEYAKKNTATISTIPDLDQRILPQEACVLKTDAYIVRLRGLDLANCVQYFEAGRWSTIKGQC